MLFGWIMEIKMDTKFKQNHDKRSIDFVFSFRLSLFERLAGTDSNKMQPAGPDVSRMKSD